MGYCGRASCGWVPSRRRRTAAEIDTLGQRMAPQQRSLLVLCFEGPLDERPARRGLLGACLDDLELWLSRRLLVGRDLGGCDRWHLELGRKEAAISRLDLGDCAEVSRRREQEVRERGGLGAAVWRDGDHNRSRALRVRRPPRRGGVSLSAGSSPSCSTRGRFAGRARTSTASPRWLGEARRRPGRTDGPRCDGRGR